MPGRAIVMHHSLSVNLYLREIASGRAVPINNAALIFNNSLIHRLQATMRHKPDNNLESVIQSRLVQHIFHNDHAALDDVVLEPVLVCLCRAGEALRETNVQLRQLRRGVLDPLAKIPQIYRSDADLLERSSAQIAICIRLLHARKTLARREC